MEASARFLGQHPSELALVLSLVLSIGLTLIIRATEKARPLIRFGIEHVPAVLKERGSRLFARLDDALVVLVVGLLAVFGGGSLFLHLADEILENSPGLTGWDTTFVQTVHRTASVLELEFFATITPLAGVYLPIIIGILVGVGLAARRHYSLLAIWVVGLLGNAALSEVLKRMFTRNRPVFDTPFMVESNFSFPSGHAMTSILLYGLLAYVASREVLRYSQAQRYLVIWALTFLGVLIGTSRLVLGVHYPSDVLAGWSVGSAWLAVLILTAEALRGRFRSSETRPEMSPVDT